MIDGDEGKRHGRRNGSASARIRPAHDARAGVARSVEPFNGLPVTVSKHPRKLICEQSSLGAQIAWVNPGCIERWLLNRPQARIGSYIGISKVLVKRRNTPVKIFIDSCSRHLIKARQCLLKSGRINANLSR
ncbi:hypothetical protein H106_05422 [Trichophyton rubrum CBS 735.88]|nr:hypothetical protein H106_05422 [Trichophyton rubrum CBS 735.88]